jgi:hypothetical protein
MAKSRSETGSQSGTKRTAAIAPAVTKNARPERVTDLLYQGGVHQGWYAAARAKNRFYVLNLGHVLGELNIAHTRMETYFKDAGTRVGQQTAWGAKYPIEFGCNFTHIYPGKREEPKQFGAAATIIFVLEEYAAKHRPDFNVYDWLRIVPAQSYVDRLDRTRYVLLQDQYAKLSADERTNLFGAEPPTSFDEVCSRAASQPSHDIVRHLAIGSCVTQFVAEQIQDVINTKFPSHLHVGPVLCSGQEGFSKKLGTKNAHEELRVIKLRSADQLPLVPLAAEPTELDFETLKSNPTAVSDTIVGCDWRAPKASDDRSVA